MDSYLFSGLKVLDVATVIAAPAAAMMLADFGADVIKVEQPAPGDMLRLIKEFPETAPGAEDYMWQMDNHGKRGIALDLKTPEGMDILHRLIAECDVFITNQPHSVRESLGITFDDVKALKPDVIYASLTAYGERGPEKYRKGFDQLAYWARSGLMDLMRAGDAPPTQGLAGMGDHPTAVAIYAGIVTALLHRERTGEGGMVHTSLLANGLWSCSATAQGTMAGGDVEQFRANRRNPPPMLRLHQCRDGRWLQFNMVRNEELLSLMLAALDASELLIDERFKTMALIWQNRSAFGDKIAAIIGERTSDEWLARCDEYGVPVNRVARIEEAPSDRQILDNDMAVKPEDTEMSVPLLVKHPIQVTSVPQVRPQRAPRHGEHSREVLRGLGFSDEAIDDYRARGVIETDDRRER